MKNKMMILLVALISAVCLITVSGCTKETVKETETELGNVSVQETENETDEEPVQTTAEESKNKEKHKITLTDSKSNSDLIKDCPKKAMAGDEVSIHLHIITDVIPHIYINGEEIGEFIEPSTYIFTMPDEEVLIESELKSAWVEETGDSAYVTYDMEGILSFEYPMDCEVKKDNMSLLIKRNEENSLENDAPYMRVDFIAFKEGETVEEYYSLLFSNVMEYYADRADLEIYENEYPVDGRQCPGFQYGFASKDGKRLYKGYYVIDQVSDVLLIYENLYLVDSEYEEDEIDTVTEKDFEHLLSTIKINY